MTDDPEDLVPGYAYRRRGASSYRGVLRRKAGQGEAWACPDDHLTASGARACAARELERRVQGAKEVFTLLHCEPCSRWWDDVAGGDGLQCPRCCVPLQRLKLALVERGLAGEARA